MNTYLVTGGTSGIGFGIVRKLLSLEDSRVVSISRDRRKIAKAKEILGLDGERVEFFSGDVSKPDIMASLAQGIESKYPSLYGLVNCAGIILPGGIEDCSLETWETTMNINVNGAFIVTKAFLPLLKKNISPASIVNISSVCSLRGGSSISYSTSKAATDMFTKCLAVELAKYRIRVNAVNPGVVVSNLQMAAGIVSNQEEYDEFLTRMKPLHPLGRIGTPEEIANAVAFLLSEESSWTTGATLSIDGGRAVNV